MTAPTPEHTADINARLKSFIERIERLSDEKKGIADDIKDVFAEAKNAGYEPKIMREVLKLRAMNASDRQEREQLLETYMHALEQGAAVKAV